MARRSVAVGVSGLLSITGALALASGANAATARPLPTAVRGLPDGRAYERVSPSDKGGARIQGVGEASPDGSTVAFASYGAFAGHPSAPSLLSYWATRSVDGWATSPVALPPSGPPQPLAANGAVRRSPDMRRQLVTTPAALTPGAADFSLAGPYQPFYYSNANIYRRDEDGHLELLSGTEADIPEGDRVAFQAFVMGATTDLGNVVFQANAGLAGAPTTADAPAGSLFYTTDGRDIENVGVLPDGTNAPKGSHLAGEGAFGGLATVSSTAISRDLSRIFFMAAPNATDPEQLYLRENAGRADARTILVSRTRRTIPDDPGQVRFRTASPDGSKVLFSSAARLTDDARETTPGSNSDGELYLYDVADDTLTNVTAGLPAGQGLSEFIGAAQDVSTVYLTSVAQVDPTTGADADLELYRWTPAGLRSVAPAGTGSRPGISTNGAKVTADGSILSFTGRGGFTDYDNVDPATGAARAMQYVYDAGRDTFACASCRPDGEPPTADVSSPAVQAGAYPRGPRTMTDDGRRIFFETRERLTPGASSSLNKVYQYDRETNEVSMISGGQSDFADSFVDATPDGGSVFFTTADRLVANDDDDVADMYVARSGGGFPDPPAGEQPCRGDACQGTPRDDASPAAPGSTSVGSGNAAPVKEPSRKTSVVVTGPRSVKARRSATLKVRVSGSGRISVAGTGIQGRTRTSSRGATYTMRFALTRDAARTLARRRTLTVNVRVTFDPRSGSTVRRTVKMRFVAAARAKARATTIPGTKAAGR